MEKFSVRKMEEGEEKYTFKQSSQISAQCGLIGYMRADMGSTGKEFWSTWLDVQSDLKTDAFRDEFDELITELRKSGNFLHNRQTLAGYCADHLAYFAGVEKLYYGVRMDSENYAYLMRLCSRSGMYNLYCYCYKKEWLDNHLENAKKGIRFITSGYDELFRVKDGESITIVQSDGSKSVRECRYIDDYHVEIGIVLFHICEFAERMEKDKATVIYNGREYHY